MHIGNLVPYQYPVKLILIVGLEKLIIYYNINDCKILLVHLSQLKDPPTIIMVEITIVNLRHSYRHKHETTE